MPKEIRKILFRAESRFFNGEIFDLFKEISWDYLIKVKLNNLNHILKKQQWIELNSEVSICEFKYQAKQWRKKRILKAIKTITGYTELEYFGQTQQVPIYQYACCCSTFEIKTDGLQEKFNERSTDENWINQAKNQLLARKKLINDFHANNLLLQIGVFAYNLSVMMRYKKKEYWQQEHNTFRDWFIDLPAKIITGGRQIKMKIYEKYYFRDDWENLERFMLS